MAMKQTAWFLLKPQDVEKACEAYVADRLKPDEEAFAQPYVDMPGHMAVIISKKRKPRAKKAAP